MGKKAEEYMRSRGLKLPRSMKKHTSLAGIDGETMAQNMRTQALADEQAGYIERGLVPVAIDFAQIAEKCGVPYEKDSSNIGPDYWVPAWYMAAWHAFVDRNQPDYEVMGTPTTKYKQFIENLIGDTVEQVMLVAETTLSAPHQGKATLDGIRAWLELNT